ncbi:MAG: hypothetical protein DSM107014_09745 [Gomphosphaeria aponina SAG 52.96 = DSM 107014]|uniref:Uncharacterized protein n=1 Tax=Gomphosphaeria aponina SAG 52.96 = DSM 107014 TaxID=1521640 RepID=A0A941JPW8_9CHRO|nr:hypothetical protein [Gomphosphaeria aponina SAG 52.96 = DSM 107014]
MKLREKFDQLTLLELFCMEPTIANPADGYWCYEARDRAGNTLSFGMDVIQESVQIELKSSGFSLVTLTFELVDTLEIIDLDQGKFAFAVAPKIREAQTRVQVELRPYIKVEGSTLKMQ